MISNNNNDDDDDDVDDGNDNKSWRCRLDACKLNELRKPFSRHVQAFCLHCKISERKRKLKVFEPRTIVDIVLKRYPRKYS